MNWHFRVAAVMLGIMGGISAQAQNIIQSASQPDTAIKATTPAPVRKAPVIKPKKPKPITKEFSGGIRLNTDGWSLFAEKGWVKSDDARNNDKFYNVRFVYITNDSTFAK